VRPPLRRSPSDRVLAGVAGGFARWLGIDPVIVRVVLVVLAIFGGSGLLLYVVGWLFIPEERQPRSVAEGFLDRARQPGSGARVVLIIVGAIVAAILALSLMASMFGGWGGGSVLLLIAVGALVLYLVNRPPTAAVPAPGAPAPAPAGDGTAVDPTVPPTVPFAYGGTGQYPGYVAPVPVPAPPPRPRSYLGLATLSLAVIVTGTIVALNVTGVWNVPAVVTMAIALAILGAGMLVGAVAGRARWLLWLAVPLLLATSIAAAVPDDLDLRFEGGVGDRTWRPMTVEQTDETFTLAAGTAVLDLTRLELPAGTTTVPIDVEVGLGELVVLVPDDARVLVDASVDLGNLDVQGLPNQQGQDLAVDATLPGGPLTGPVLDLTLSTTIGNLEVSRA
jgi:phage shock protein PspC (stress-responsive transcriptional regulator)/predicted membrane protein